MNPEQPQHPTPQQPQPVAPPQPVAYDAEGRPLYAHPPQQPVQPQQPMQPQQPVQQPAQAEQPAPNVVQMIRPLDPPKQEMTPEVRQRHEESRKEFPFLNLSEGEYVIRAVRRHPIGLLIPMTVGVLLLALALTVLFSFESIADSLLLSGPAADPASIAWPVFLFCIVVGLGMFIAYYVYVNNKFFLTNESVIQEIQHSLFSRNEQTVSLANIEDASFDQSNIIQHLFNYGSIRLSTEGDETTYRFTYVANPKDHIATLNNAVEAFKLGRPVGVDDS